MTRSEEILREVLGDELAEHLMAVVPGRYFYVPNNLPSGPYVSAKRKARIEALYQSGVKVRQIAKQLGISSSRVYQILNLQAEKNWKRRAKGRRATNSRTPELKSPAEAGQVKERRSPSQHSRSQN